MIDEIIDNRREDRQPSVVMLYELVGMVSIGAFLAAFILQFFPQFAALVTVIAGTVTILAALIGIRMDGDNDA